MRPELFCFLLLLVRPPSRVVLSPREAFPRCLAACTLSVCLSPPSRVALYGVLISIYNLICFIPFHLLRSRKEEDNDGGGRLRENSTPQPRAIRPRTSGQRALLFSQGFPLRFARKFNNRGWREPLRFAKAFSASPFSLSFLRRRSTAARE